MIAPDVAPYLVRRGGVADVERQDSDMPAGPSDPPPTRPHSLLDSIETSARELMKLLPHSPRPRAILAEVEALRRETRAPLPNGWWWSGAGDLRLSGRGMIATVFTNGAWMIFAGFEEGAAEVKRGKAKDGERARIAVEDYFWQHGWPK